MAELRRHFRPEFLNRVDDIVLFRPLTLAEIERIVDLQTADLRKRLATATSGSSCRMLPARSSRARASTRSTAPARSSATSSTKSRAASAAPSSPAR
jgi:ATP-dependent Clp protease ATP-binding subunit ClpA